MTLRRTVYELISTAAPVLALVPAERMYERGAVSDTPELPFIVLAWNGSLLTTGRVTPELLDIYAHDERGDYSRIESILSAVYPVLAGAVQYVGVSGYRLTQADYLSKSADLVDTDRGTNVQFSSWKIIGGQP